MPPVSHLFLPLLRSLLVPRAGKGTATLRGGTHWAAHAGRGGLQGKETAAVTQRLSHCPQGGHRGDTTEPFDLFTHPPRPSVPHVGQTRAN